MKSFSKQTNKWILSTLLVAALGSQYYFSVSSTSLGSIDMSSKSEEKLAELIKQLDSQDTDIEYKEKRKKELNAEFAVKIAAEKAIKTPQQIEAVAAQRPQKIELEAVPKATTEATTSFKFECTDCAPPGVEKAIIDSSIKAVLAELKNPKKPVAPVEAKVEIKKEEAIIETAADKRAREKEEREEKKQAIKDRKEKIKQDKLDKLNDQKSDRNDAFADKMEEAAEKCQDNLSCKVTRFASLLKTYSGSKKIDQFAATKAFNQYIDKDLRASLNAKPGSDIKVAAMHSLDEIADLPSEYKSLKIRTIDIAKSAQTETATTINGMYKESKKLLDQKRPIESQAAQLEAIEADKSFRRDTDVIYSNIYEGLNSSNDHTTLEYFKSGYVADMKTLISRITNPSGVTETIANPTAGSRGGRTGNTTVVNNGNPSQDNASNNLGSVNFGTPAANRTGSRTAK